MKLVKASAPRPRGDYSPRECKSRITQVLPLTGLFVLLAGMYLFFPKTASRTGNVELKTLLFVPDPGEQQGRNTLWQAKTLCGLNYAREYAAMPTKSTTEISVEMESVVEIYSPCPVTSA